MIRREYTMAAAALAAVLVVGFTTTWVRPFNWLALGLTVAACAAVALPRSWAALAAVIAVALPYHLLDYPHDALAAPVLVALFRVAEDGPGRRTGVALGGVAGLAVLSGLLGGDIRVVDQVAWMLAAAACGEAVRRGRAHLAARERLRVAADVHDLLAHTVTAARVQADVAAHLLAAGAIDGERLGRCLAAIVAACDRARADLGSIVDGLRPPADFGAGALGLTVDGDPGELPEPARLILAEAITNAARHGSGPAAVTVSREDGRLTLTVANPVAFGNGLRGMAERARAHRGELSAVHTLTVVMPQ
ncbi:two-component sensor histidine kinase [Actinorhabdospora filicis]|uniref:Two-component sensor histidine kinase n=1 Tax=Actinorhabdospora filicis TaxID=1785913 RepID=A0A9W6SGI0_9ACTN|nr:histidine kinase [Actinorhabdospora filicis]GLZ76724.1 two-component sensor histidine kinase [Actinorhabdospora filicis]